MVIKILFVILIIGSVAFVGFQYVKSASVSKINFSKKQIAVKARRNEFGASNWGTSMDDCIISIVPFDNLGINC